MKHKNCSQEIRSDLVLGINPFFLMLISTKQNVGKILQDTANMINVIINNNV